MCEDAFNTYRKTYFQGTLNSMDNKEVKRKDI